MEELLQMQGICKAFSGNEVLHQVDFTVRKGEVHALIGENGAGKSTLIKVLAGVHRADKGTVTLEGRTVEFKTPKEAILAGVSTIHQEFNLVPQLDVMENIFLGREKRLAGVISKKEMYEETKALLARIGADIDPKTPMKKLGVAAKQMVEICKALSVKAKIMVMDDCEIIGLTRRNPIKSRVLPC